MKYVMDSLSQVCPEFKKFSDTVYNFPGYSHSVSSLRSSIATGLSFAFFGGGDGSSIGFSSPAHVASSMASILSKKYDFPFWVIPPVIMDVLSKIKMPEEYSIDSIPFGFPGMFFVLPKGTLTGDDSEDVAVVGAGILNQKSRQDLSSQFNIGRFDKGEKDREAVFVCAFDSAMTTWGLSIPLEKDSPVINVDDVSKLEFVDISVRHNADNIWLSHTLMPFVFTLLAFMAARPEISDAEETIKKVIKKTGKVSKEPRVLGRKYVVQRSFSKSGESGTSVATHWRRGHIRNQRYGPKNSMIKHVLIDPVLVNPPC